MKVGIITIPDFDNYGNRLQNYALQEMVSSVGYDAVSFVPYRPNIIKTFIKSFLNIENKGKISYKNAKLQRLSFFLKFDNQFVNTVVIGTTNYPSGLSNECDCFIAGSDQIWNPLWYTDYSFLRFAENKKKFAYAASFGCDNIPKDKMDIYKQLIGAFSFISVREKSGQDIIFHLLKKDVAIVPDPTLALTCDKWRSVAKKVHGYYTGKPYILLYFLGGLDDERKMVISSIKSNYNMEMCDLLDYENERAYKSGPSEFLFLIDHAKMILTDSFHACIFSIIFHKQFMVFDRLGKGNVMGNRIDTLLRKFELMDCKYTGNIDFFNYNTESIDTILNKERMRALSFLKDMLRGVNNEKVS